MPKNLEYHISKFILALEKQSLVALSSLQTAISSEEYNKIIGAKEQYSELSGLLIEGTGCRRFMELPRKHSSCFFLDRYALQFAAGYYSLNGILESFHGTLSKPKTKIALDDFKKTANEISYSEFREYSVNCTARKEFELIIELIRYVRSEYKKPSVCDYTNNFRKKNIRNILKSPSPTSELNIQDSRIRKRILKTRQTYQDLFSS